MRPAFRTRQSSGIVAVVLCLVACTEGISGGSPAATAQRTASATTGSDAQSLCSRLAPVEVARAAGGNAAVEAEASGPSVCTYRIDAGAHQAHHIAVRLEDTFTSIAQVEAAFPGGISVAYLGDGAFWGHNVGTLWLSHDGLLYAVQVVGLESEEVTRTIAIAVAERFLLQH